MPWEALAYEDMSTEMRERVLSATPLFKLRVEYFYGANAKVTFSVKSRSLTRSFDTVILASLAGFVLEDIEQSIAKLIVGTGRMPNLDTADPAIGPTGPALVFHIDVMEATKNGSAVSITSANDSVIRKVLLSGTTLAEAVSDLRSRIGAASSLKALSDSLNAALK